MIVVFSLADWLFQSMFRSGERTFRSGERMFRSGERTFRSGEHKWKAASVHLQITVMANSSWLSWQTHHGYHGKLIMTVMANQSWLMWETDENSEKNVGQV